MIKPEQSRRATRMLVSKPLMSCTSSAKKAFIPVTDLTIAVMLLPRDFSAGVNWPHDTKMKGSFNRSFSEYVVLECFYLRLESKGRLGALLHIRLFDH